MNSILKYNQAKMRIFQLIADQHLKIGDRLPPERDLVENFELSLITVRRAMHELEEENIIERRPRMGTYLKQSIAQIPELGRILYLKIYKTEYGENIFLDTMVQEVEFQLKKEHIQLLYHSAVSPSVEIAEAAAECLGIFVTGWLDVKWRDFLKSLGLPVMVIGGVAGSFLGEYQAGGLIVVLGLGRSADTPITGYFCGTGMHGGKILLRTDCPPGSFPAQVRCERAGKEELVAARPYIDNYCRFFGVDREKVLSGVFYLLHPNSANPYRQLYVSEG